MKSLVPYVSNLLADATRWCGIRTLRDTQTVAERVEHEGISFLTITLPAFSSSFLEALERGCIASNDFPGFRKDSRRFPRFLGGLLRQVFDASTGVVLQEPSTTAIFWVQQICLAFKKVSLECSPRRTREALDRYLECDNEVEEWSLRVDPRLLDEFHSASIILFGSVFSDVDRKVSRFEHVPKHGPGATAEKLPANARYDLREWTERLQPYFPADYFVPPNGDGRYDHVNFVEPGAERPVRVVTVPKTLKTPRIIAIEPACMQYAQQALLEQFVTAIEGSPLEKVIGFSDQSRNRIAACEASKTRVLCTMDLSEASDRVSNLLVKTMFRTHPVVNGAVQACRSKQADVFGQRRILAKFASMGSALCFPIEAMVFLTILRMAWCREQGLPCSSRKGVSTFLDTVSVYGDDLLFPARWIHFAQRELEAFGLKVNANKTFSRSKFRESCGGDYFDGVPVKPVYFRQLLETAADPSAKRSALVSYVSTRNQLYWAGCWSTASLMDDRIKGLIPYPIVQDESPIIGRSSCLPWQPERISASLHRPEVKGLVLRPKPPKDRLDGIPALWKFFLKRGAKPRERGHLEHYGRPRSVNTKIAWATPY